MTKFTRRDRPNPTVTPWVRSRVSSNPLFDVWLRFSLLNVEIPPGNYTLENYMLCPVARVVVFERCVPDASNVPRVFREEPLPDEFGWEIRKDPGVFMVEPTLKDAKQTADNALRESGWIL